MGETLRLTLPLPPNMANGRMHWRTKNRKRQDYYQYAMVVAMLGAPRQPLPKARAKIVLYVWALMDYDNMMARLKWPLDVLVDAGWIEDDGPQHLEFAEMPSQFVDRKNQRVEIELLAGS